MIVIVRAFRQRNKTSRQILFLQIGVMLYSVCYLITVEAGHEYMTLKKGIMIALEMPLPYGFGWAMTQLCMNFFVALL